MNFPPRPDIADEQAPEAELPFVSWGWMRMGCGTRIGPVRHDPALVERAMADPASGIVGWDFMTAAEEERFQQEMPRLRLKAQWIESKMEAAPS